MVLDPGIHLFLLQDVVAVLVVLEEDILDKLPAEIVQRYYQNITTILFFLLSFAALGQRMHPATKQQVEIWDANKFIGMDVTMQHFNQYNTQSQLNWEGIQSNRFPKMRLMHPSKDLIQTGLDFPLQTPLSGRKHYDPNRSSQFAFKPRTRMYKDLHHWQPKPTGKKILDLQLTQPHPRYEKGHFQQPQCELPDKFAGIRTFYSKKLKGNQREYSVEDRMQRKTRADQYSLRKETFRNEALGMTQQFPKVRY